MSSVVIAGNTSGTCTLQAPAVAGSTVLTLPTTSATLITDSSGILNIGSGQLYKDASGNVGIGTINPDVKLHIGAATPTQGILAHLTNTTGSTGTGAYLQLTSAGVADWAIGQPAGATGALSFRYGTNISSAGTEYMRIDSSGNVGIGGTPANGMLELFKTSGEAVLRINNTVGNAWLTLNGASAGYIHNVSNTPTVFTTNSTERMRIDSSGNLLVGCTSVPNVGVAGQYGFSNSSTEVVISKNVNTTALYIRQVGGGAATAINFYNGTNQVGSITTSTTNSSYNTASDQRLKENIIDAPSALVSVNAIKVRSFDWKTDGTHVDYGYIAQELLEVVPEAVAVPENSKQMMGVDFGKLTPRLVKAIQELKAIIDTQQEQINSLLGK